MINNIPERNVDILKSMMLQTYDENINYKNWALNIRNLSNHYFDIMKNISHSFYFNYNCLIKEKSKVSFLPYEDGFGLTIETMNNCSEQVNNEMYSLIKAGNSLKYKDYLLEIFDNKKYTDQSDNIIRQSVIDHNEIIGILHECINIIKNQNLNEIKEYLTNAPFNNTIYNNTFENKKYKFQTIFAYSLEDYYENEINLFLTKLKKQEVFELVFTSYIYSDISAIMYLNSFENKKYSNLIFSIHKVFKDLNYSFTTNIFNKNNEFVEKIIIENNLLEISQKKDIIKNIKKI